MTLPKISFVTCTYGRSTCIRRMAKMYIEQDYEGPKEWIIYNTAIRHPIHLDAELLARGDIRVVNNNTDLETHAPYTNVGAIRRDSLQFATGKYYICGDDDDYFYPWMMRQCVDGIRRYPNAVAWKPIYSLFETPEKLEQACNTLEASFIVDLETLRDIGFRYENGSEHLSWISKLQYTDKMIDGDENSVPGYCYRWADPSFISGHKQSGNMGDKNNFENHKNASRDHFTTALSYDPALNFLDSHYEYFRQNIDGRTSTPLITPTFPVRWSAKLIDKYVRKYL